MTVMTGTRTTLEWEFTVRQEREGARTLIHAAFLTAWIAGGVSVMGEIPEAVNHSLFKGGLVFVVWFTPIAAWTFAAIWRFTGAEVISVRNGVLRVTRRIGPVPIGNQLICSAADVHAMRVDQRVYRLRGGSKTRHVITFECQGRRRELLGNLSAERAHSLMSGPLQRFAEE